MNTANSQRALGSVRERNDHLRILANQISRDLGTDVSRVVAIVESNGVENMDNPNGFGVMQSFLEMTGKYVNTLEDTRKNFLIRICLLVPFGLCFFLSFIPFVQHYANLGLQILKPMIRLGARPPPNISLILTEKIEIDEMEIKVSCLGVRYKRAIAFTETLNSQSRISEEDIREMKTLVGINFASDELGTLEVLLNKNIVNTCYVKSMKATYYIVLYVRVFLLYSDLQMRMLSVAHSAHAINDPNGNTLSNHFIQLRDCFKNENQRVKDFLTALLAPRHRIATSLALFEASHYPEVDMCLQENGISLRLPLRNINCRIAFELRRESGLREWMNMANNPVGTIWKTCISPDGNRIRFRLEPVPEEENWFFIISAQWGSWYVFVKDNTYLRGKSSKPGEEGMFKFVEVENGRYMISVKSWPGKFIYMEDVFLQKIKIRKSEKPFDETFWWSIMIQEEEDEEEE